MQSGEARGEGHRGQGFKTHSHLWLPLARAFPLHRFPGPCPWLSKGQYTDLVGALRDNSVNHRPQKCQGCWPCISSLGPQQMKAWGPLGLLPGVS